MSKENCQSDKRLKGILEHNYNRKHFQSEQRQNNAFRGTSAKNIFQCDKQPKVHFQQSEQKISFKKTILNQFFSMISFQTAKFYFQN